MAFDVSANSDVANIIAGLPASARILTQLAELQRADIQIRDIANALGRSATLCAGLIAAANRSAHDGEKNVETVDAAVARLGPPETFCLAGALAWRECSRRLALYAASADEVWSAGLFNGLLMRQLAVASNVDPGAAYMAGLLRSIGKVVLDELARRTAEMPPYAEGDESLPQWEDSMLGYTNTDVAAAVLEVWQFPIEIGTAVRCHYAPTATTGIMARLLNIAAGASDLRGYGFRGEEEFWRITPERLAACSLNHESLAAAVAVAATEFHRVHAAFGLQARVEMMAGKS